MRESREDAIRAFVAHQQRLHAIPNDDHPRWGLVLAPRDIGQLFLILEQLESLLVTAWRGQACARWPIDSGLVRRVRDHHNAGPLNEENVRPIEMMLLEDARRAGYGDSLGDLELLARLQHHGAATRLLDCTRSPMIACWFACQDEQHREEDGVLIGLRLPQNAVWLRNEHIGLPVNEVLDSVGGEAFWWQPRALSARIPAQQAVFVFSKVEENRWGTVRLGPKLTPDTDLEDGGNVPGVVMVLLTREFKRSMRGRWANALGFTEETMFPDLDGFARANGVQRRFSSSVMNLGLTRKLSP